MIPVVFINCSKVDFISKIINGEKEYETRTRNTLRPLVGRRILIAETGKGTPKIRCSAYLDAPIVVNDKQSWDNFKPETCVPDGSEHDWDGTTKRKWLYRLLDVQEVCGLDWKEGKRHGVVWMEYEPAPYRMIYDGDHFIDGEDHDSLEGAIAAAKDCLLMWESDEMREWGWESDAVLPRLTKEQIERWDYMIYNCGCYVIEFDNETGDYTSVFDAVWPRYQNDMDELDWMPWEYLKRKWKEKIA